MSQPEQASSLLARLISDSVRDMIVWARSPAGEFITASHRRLIRHLETRDADGAARETEHYSARLGQCQETLATVPGQFRPRLSEVAGQ